MGSGMAMVRAIFVGDDVHVDVEGEAEDDVAGASRSHACA